MEKRQDNWESIIKEELNNEAEQIKEKLAVSETVDIAEKLKKDIHIKLQKDIREYEKEAVYSKLSEEDREALELGRRVKYRRRHRKVYVALAAVSTLVLAIGVTSMGGAERISTIMNKIIGEREVVKINSDQEAKVVADEKQERAYQEVRDEFGIEPVVLINAPLNMKFIEMNLDQQMQTAEFLYQYNKKNILYIISAGFYNSSFGIDKKDELIEEEEVEIRGIPVDIMVYSADESNEKRCWANFKYKELEYFLAGTMEKEECELILENLYFF